MRKTAAGIATAMALAFMMVAQPWGRLGCDPATCSMTTYWGDWLWTLLVSAFYVFIPTVVLTVVLVAVLGMRSTRTPHDAAVRAALGETQGAAIRRAAIRGLRDGAVGIGGAYGVAGIVPLAINSTAGWPGFSTDSYLWIVRLGLALTVFASLVLSHVIDTARPRRTPVERLYDDARPLAPAGRRGRRGAVVIAAFTAAALGVVAGLAIAIDITRSFVVTNAAGIAVGAAWLGCLALALVVALPTARRALPRVLARVAAWTKRAGATKAGAVIEARASAPSRAGGRLVVVLGALVWMVAALSSAPTAPQQSDRWVATVAYGGTFDPETAASELLAIDGVGAVVTGVLVTESGPEPDLIMALDPADLRGLDDGLARALEKHPTALLVSPWRDTNLTHYPGADIYGFTPTGIVIFTGNDGVFMNATVAQPQVAAGHGYLVYATDDADLVAVGQAIGQVNPSGSSIEWTSASMASGTAEFGTPWWATLINIGIPVVLLGGPLVALGIGAVRARRADDATFSALGATARTLRAAIAIEVGAVAAWAVATGAAAGFVTRIIMTAAQRARLSLTGVITDNYLATAVGSVAWLPALIVGGAAVAVLTVVAFLAARPRPIPAADARIREEVAL